MLKIKRLKAKTQSIIKGIRKTGHSTLQKYLIDKPLWNANVLLREEFVDSLGQKSYISIPTLLSPPPTQITSLPAMLVILALLMFVMKLWNLTNL